MARISELHYSNAYAASSGVNEFLEVALAASEDPADFVISFYQSDGSVGLELPLTHPDIQVSIDPDNNEQVFVISADDFPILLTDPDGGGVGNYEAYALTNTTTNEVIDFYDIGGGTQNIVAMDGAAAGAISDNLPVLVGPNATTTTLQFNQPDPDTLTYGSVAPGDTGLTCFVRGALVETPEGARRIEDLSVGDLVLTRDHGAQPVRWIGQRTVTGRGAFAPVRLRRGFLNATRNHFLSQQHRVLLSGWQAELLFGEDEVLVPAKSLARAGVAKIAPQPRVTYFHLLLDSHQILRVDGVESESFYPGAQAMDGMAQATRDEVLALFPELAGPLPDPGPTARATMTVQEGIALAALI
ncbi:Hint domain-containing protein [Shimia sp. SDUM112013]|uniref:Hint domain-containing protein n=1 Tax=Shimia sp. SDUM112013 TaxID=3136160 RepID=UPI0032EADDCE